MGVVYHWGVDDCISFLSHSISFLFHFYFIPLLFHFHFISISFLPALYFIVLPTLFHSRFIFCPGWYHWYFISCLGKYHWYFLMGCWDVGHMTNYQKWSKNESCSFLNLVELGSEVLLLWRYDVKDFWALCFFWLFAFFPWKQNQTTWFHHI